MEYCGDRICFSYSDMTPVVMSYDCLKKQVMRGRVERAVRGGGEGSPALFYWDTLPLKYRQKYIMLNGSPEELLRKECSRPHLELDGKARQWYAEYRYEMNGRQQGLSLKLVEEYTLNASVCNALLDAMCESVGMQHALGGHGGGRFAQVMRLSEDYRKWYGHTLPGSEGRLRNKLREYERDGFVSLVSNKVGNRNTLKITEECGELLIALKRSRVPVMTDSQIFEEYNKMARERGWKELSSQNGMSAWLQSPSVRPLWYDAVHGEQASRQLFCRKHQTLLPTRRDSLWYGDGTKLNLYYRDDAGNVRTTQVYEVMDAMSEVLLGYHISDKEDYEAQYHAFRMAIQVSRHRPYEIVHDNQGGHKRLESEGLFAKICHVHRTTQPYNGESKTIESAFGRFQQQVLHKDWRFTGQNVTSRKSSSKPNLEFIEANKESLYTLDELKDAYAAARKEWNTKEQKGQVQSRWERYMSSVNESTPVVSEADMVDMFWLTSKKMVTMTDCGLTLTVKGREYRYEVLSAPGVPDHAWRSLHTWERFVVKYDPYDLSMVRLYSKDASGGLHFEAVAEPYILIHRAIQDQLEGDALFIRQEQSANLRDRVERQVAGQAIERRHGVSPEQNGLKSPVMKGVPSSIQREVARRTDKYSMDPEDFQLGKHTKSVSMLDWREEREEKPSEGVSRRVVAASKL